MKCSTCGQENKSGLRFCVKCGAKLPGESAKSSLGQLFCTNCGRKNPPNARFCEICGSEILKPTVHAEPIPQPGPPPAPHPAPTTARKPAHPGKKSGWIWVLAGSVLFLVGASSYYYFLKSKPAEPIADEGGPLGAASADGMAPGTCKSEEKALYVEDFQDGSAEDWPGIPDAQSFFSLGPAPEDGGNEVLIIHKSEGVSGQLQGGPQLRITPFSNAVLRLRFYINGTLSTDNSDWFSFNWLAAPEPFMLEGQQVFDSRYQLSIGWNYFEMRRLQQPVSNVSVARSANPSSDEWHFLEIATYQPRTEVWLDGRQVMEYEDQNPLPAGTFALEAWLQDSNVRLFFDEVVICELNAPFSP